MIAPVIRPATPADATHLACFVDMASEGMALLAWEELRQPGQTLFETGRSRAMRTEGAFSYTNAHVAEVDGTIAGGIVSYRIPEVFDRSYRTAGTGQPPPTFATPLIELEETVPGAWYDNIVAVYPEYRGQRIGESLLAHSEKLGKRARSAIHAITVDADNTAARNLYARFGFRETDRRPLVPFPARPNGGEWLLLTKPIG